MCASNNDALACKRTSGYQFSNAVRFTICDFLLCGHEYRRILRLLRNRCHTAINGFENSCGALREQGLADFFAELLRIRARTLLTNDLFAVRTGYDSLQHKFPVFMGSVSADRDLTSAAERIQRSSLTFNSSSRWSMIEELQCSNCCGVIGARLN